MGEIGRKLREPRKGIVEPLEHIIESDGERLKLTRPTSRRDAFLQVGWVDPLERTRHFSQRTQATPGHRDRNQSRGKNAAREDY